MASTGEQYSLYCLYRNSTVRTGASSLRQTGTELLRLCGSPALGRCQYTVLHVLRYYGTTVLQYYGTTPYYTYYQVRFMPIYADFVSLCLLCRKPCDYAKSNAGIETSAQVRGHYRAS